MEVFLHAHHARVPEILQRDAVSAVMIIAARLQRIVRGA
jgi:hypothetical protein